MASAVFDTRERRHRLVRRHHLARTATDVVDATEGVAALHASDPTSPYLSAWARVPGFAIAHLDDELYVARRLWRQHAMRRTLFVVPTPAVPEVEAGAARDVARRERRRVVRLLEAELPARQVEPWLADAQRVTLAALEGAERSTRELLELVGALRLEVTSGSGRWAQRAPVGSRLLLLLAMEGRIVRARPAGTWRSSQYRWARVEDWAPQPLSWLSEEEGRVRLLRRYLAGHGPATTADVRWWTGWTVAATRRALADVDAVAVDLEDGEPAWVLADDLAPVAPPGTSVTLLPALDPTPMGYTQRDWFLGPHAGELFDRNGNVGPTVWVDGRIVGGWGQRRSGEIVTELLEPVADAAAAQVAARADELTAWFDGEVAVPRFPTPLGRRLSS